MKLWLNISTAMHEMGYSVSVLSLLWQGEILKKKKKIHHRDHQTIAAINGNNFVAVFDSGTHIISTPPNVSSIY